jgi:hypothetical protein
MGASYTDHLIVQWSRREKDLLIGGPNGPDRHLLHAALNCTPIGSEGQIDCLTKELERRGYDLSTLRFYCKRTRKP